MQRWLGVMALGVVVSAIANVAAGPHPYHNDGGLIHWRPSLAGALKEADRGFRPVLIEICKETDKNAVKMADLTFRDPRLAQIINRYCVPVVLDSKLASSDATIKSYMAKAGKAEPFLLLISDKGQYLAGMSGFKKTNEVEGAILNILMESYKMTEAAEKRVEEQLTELDTHIRGKDWAKALPLYKIISNAKGYSGKKDIAHDLMDTAQADLNLKYRDALKLVVDGQYDEAKTILGDVMKDKEMADLPRAGEAKDYLAAVKLLEDAGKHIESKAANGKSLGLQKLDTVLRLYADTPFANLAAAQRRELIKEATTKK